MHITTRFAAGFRPLFQGNRGAQKHSNHPLNHPPKVALVDLVATSKVDIDGDGIGDMPHHELVRRILKAYCPSAQVTKLLTQLSPGKHPERQIAEVFNGIAEQAEGGNYYDAVCIPLGIESKYSDIELPDRELSPKNIINQRAAINRELNDETEKRWQFIPPVVAAIERLIKTGTPVYIAAGNYGSDAFSFLNVVHQAIQVGALHGNRKAPYSVDNSVINRWEQGFYEVSKVKGGYDLTGDNVPEVLDSEVSGQVSLGHHLVGKPASQVMANEKTLELLAKPDKAHAAQFLYPITLLRQHHLLSDLYDAECLLYGDYAAFNPKTSGFIPGFRVKSGRVVYDPGDTGKLNVVNYLSGTSLAAPKATAIDLQRQLVG